MTASAVDILGLFPSLTAVGGVQVSGREAWKGIVSQIGAERACLYTYDPKSSKPKALLKLIATRRPAKAILVWHLHLLPLLHFVNGTPSRVILFLHGIEAWKRHNPLVSFGLRKVDLFLSNSDHTWRRFVALNPEFNSASHRTVHLGIDDAASDAKALSCPGRAVLMIGRLLRSEDYKGHRQMIDSWPLVQKVLPNAQLWIVGDGNLRSDLEELARARVPHGIRFYGEISDREKDELLCQSGCLALPSTGEGFGLVYLEAMRAGRPCLVSTLDAGREVVNPPEAGLAVNPNSPEELAGAVVRLLTATGEWRAWSKRAKRRYDQQFTAHHFRKRLLAALSEN